MSHPRKSTDPDYWMFMLILCFVFLVISVVYIIDGQYRQHIINTYDQGYNSGININTYNQGYNSGINYTLELMFNKALKCETIDLFNETLGVNLISIECLPEEVIKYFPEAQQDA